ncbi:unnamed protein product [Brugia pahangi]|uniref:Uncharacterized protein n=1 Tax=Brugia pahangi TaxID=6280 RepID=A0A0N4T1X9_BRUPA|nr:unnamed protein product [Brugia pahangi]
MKEAVPQCLLLFSLLITEQKFYFYEQNEKREKLQLYYDPRLKRWASQLRFGKRANWASKVRFG